MGRCRPGSNSWRTAKFNAVAVCNEIAVLCYFGRRLIKATFKEQLSLVRPKIGWAALKGHRAICNKCVHVETICSFDRGRGGGGDHATRSQTNFRVTPDSPIIYVTHILLSRLSVSTVASNRIPKNGSVPFSFLEPHRPRVVACIYTLPDGEDRHGERKKEVLTR